jgi:hypothetical protein
MTQHAHAVQWILGGLLAVSAATVAAIGSTTEPASAQPAPRASANETRAGAVSALQVMSAPSGAVLSSAAAPPPARAASGGARAPQAATVARTPLPAGQVWQCVIDGERIFSDAPCGEHASIRQLRELNVMDAPPPRSYPVPYAPPSAPAPTFAPAPPDDSDYADPWGPELLWAHGYARRNYLPRQDNHIHPQPQAHPHPHPGRN